MPVINIVNDINAIVQSYNEDIVKRLAQQFNFDPNEAFRFLKDSSVINHDKPSSHEIKVFAKSSANSSAESSANSSANSSAESSANTSSVTTPATKQKFVLPWSGNVIDTCCQGLKNNYGLFTQCSNPKHGETQFCKQCVAAIDKNSDEHPCGTVKERLAVGIHEYKDPKGKKVIHYTQYMKKFAITKQQVIDSALRYNVIIDHTHFTPPTTRRGRPSKKTTFVNDSDDEKRPPGRPKKLASTEPSPEDIISTILATSSPSSPPPSSHKLSIHTPNTSLDHFVTSHQRIPTSPLDD